MPEVMIFQSTNDKWSKQTQAGSPLIEPRYGWCAAASALWCLNALNDVAPAESRPGETRTGILQVKYRWNPSGWRDVQLLEIIGLEAQPLQHDVSLAVALEAMVKGQGVFYFGNEVHAMAADTRSAQPLFYDIESGLYRYGNATEFKQGISNRYQGGKWEVIQVHLAD